jgi:hypothetical protein
LRDKLAKLPASVNESPKLNRRVQRRVPAGYDTAAYGHTTRKRRGRTTTREDFIDVC